MGEVVGGEANIFYNGHLAALRNRPVWGRDVFWLGITAVPDQVYSHKVYEVCHCVNTGHIQEIQSDQFIRMGV